MNVSERIESARAKTRRVIEHISYLVQLHEHNAIVVFSTTLPHTTRAALTGLRNRGYGLERSRPEEGKPSVYRIVP